MVLSESAVKAAVDLSHSKSKNAVQRGLTQLSSFGNAEDDAVQLFNIPGVVNAFARAAASGESNEIKQQGIGGLVKLAYVEQNRVRLLATPGVLPAMLDAITKGRTNEIRQYALGALTNLATHEDNRRPMLQTPGLVKAFSGAISTGKTLEHQQYGLMGMLNMLSEANDEDFPLREHPELIEAFLHAASRGETTELKYHGIRGLVILATCREYDAVLFETPHVVDTFIKAYLKGKTYEIKRQGLRGLIGLCVLEDTKMKMCTYPGVVDTFVKAARKGENAEAREYGMRGLWNMSFSALVADKLVDDYEILDLVMDVGPQTYVAFLLLHLVASPRARKVVQERGEAVVCTLVKCAKLNESETRMFAKLALVILTSGTRPEFLTPGKQTLDESMKMLDIALFDMRVMGNIWTLHHPLPALRYLTREEENRKLLGTTWLMKIPAAIDLGLENSDREACESAVDCLLNYAKDEAEMGMVHEILVEVVDRCYWWFPERLGEFHKILEKILVAPEDEQVGNTRTMNEMIKIHQGLPACVVNQEEALNAKGEDGALKSA